MTSINSSPTTDVSPTWLIVGLVLAGGSIGCLAQVPQVREAARWAARNVDHIATVVVGVGGLTRGNHGT
ncbi:hypothetical protein [Microbacterium sp. NPDC055455]